MKNKLKNKTAFSLIELSIVILIVGIIVAGVTQSSRMIDAFKLSSARNLTQSSPVASMKNLLMWYDATSAASFDDAEADNNTAIATWYDINPTSTTKYNIASSGINRPLYISSCINSLPCVRFDGSNDYLVNTSADISGDELTIFIVAKRIASSIYTSPVTAVPGAAAGDNNTNSAVIAFYEGGGTVMQTYRNGAKSQAPHLGNGISYVAETIFNGSTNVFYINGAVRTAVASTGSFASSKFIVGARWEGSAYNWFYNGNVAEVIVFNRALKSEERDAIETYLGKKWGITVS